MIGDLLVHLRGEHDEPVLPFSFDRTGFHLAYRWVSFLSFGKLDLDRADFGETHPVILSQRKTRLWVGERVIAPVALKSWIARRFSLFDSTEKVVIGFFDPP